MKIVRNKKVIILSAAFAVVLSLGMGQTCFFLLCNSQYSPFTGYRYMGVCSHNS
ncbi:MAG TPA: hypothetical protein VJ767_01025 [Nitrososphaeraceae archaeon]|nr:hypothetical protein [Nitrososphaeraceae archaeon]